MGTWMGRTSISRSFLHGQWLLDDGLSHCLSSMPAPRGTTPVQGRELLVFKILLLPTHESSNPLVPLVQPFSHTGSAASIPESDLHLHQGSPTLVGFEVTLPPLAAYFLKHEKSSFALCLHRGSKEMTGTPGPRAPLGREEIQVWLACLGHRGPQDSRSDTC